SSASVRRKELEVKIAAAKREAELKQRQDEIKLADEEAEESLLRLQL
ncbi:unnamed protein product, partial [Allacma fusca]